MRGPTGGPSPSLQKCNGDSGLRGVWDVRLGPAVDCGMAADSDPLAQLPAKKGTAAFGDLPSKELILAQALGPEWDQGAVGRAGHRILIDSGSRSKKSRDEIDFSTGGGDNNSQAIELSEEVHPWCESGDFNLRVIDSQIVASSQYLRRLGAKSADQSLSRGTREWASGREVQFNGFSIASCGEKPAECLKPHDIPRMPEFGKKD